MNRILPGLLVMLVAVSPPVGWAQAPESTVTVRATQVGEAEASAPTAFVSEIDAAQHVEQVETVTDALAESVGVSVRRFGGLGAFSTISIRGSSANQVQIYLDGVPMSRARNETVNLSDLPLDSLQRIDVYRGTIPASFGSGAIGGVVNLITKAPSSAPESQAGVSYGSFETRKATASRTQTIGGFDLLGFVTYLGSEGNFPFPDDRGTPLNPYDDTTTDRPNNAFNSVEALLKGGYSLQPGLRLELTSETFFKDSGVPGLGFDPSLDSSFAELRALNYVRLRSTDWLARSVDADFTLYGIYQKDEFSDPQHKLGVAAQDRHDQTGVIGGNFSGSYYAPPIANVANTLGWFVELSHETFDPQNDLQTRYDMEPNQERLHATLVGQDQIGLWSEKILLVPTVRYEHVRDSSDGPLTAFGSPTIPAATIDHDLVSPSIGAEVRVQPWLTVRGNIGRYERPPNFSELFGNSGTVVGDPNLTPESALNRDVGFVLRYEHAPWIKDADLEYVYFNNDVDDLIVLLKTGVKIFKPQNVSGAQLRGHEVSGRITLADHLRLAMNYTRQESHDRNPTYGGIYLGKELPNRPSDEAYARVEALFDPLRFYYEFNFVAGNFLDEAHLNPEVPSRDIHTFGVAWRILPPVTLSFEARNVTDNQISDVGDFPLPGRAFFGTVMTKF